MPGAWSSSRPLPDLGDARRRTEARLRAAGIASAAVEASWLLEHATGLSRALQVLERARPLEGHEAERLEAALRRREAREPLQLVLGETWFAGVRLEVRPGVLVPRPETERLVELILAEAPKAGTWRVVDVGTGSGAIALAIAHALARARREGDVIAGDVDPAAVALARDNARALALPVRVVESDLLAHVELRDAARACDVLVANLPYLPDADRADVPSEVRWDGDLALYAGREGLDVARRLLREAHELLPPEATLWFELDPRNSRVLLREAVAAGWPEARLERDLNARERFVRLRPAPRARRAGGS